MNDKFTEGLVSIIMPVFNASRYVIESVESIIAQTYNNWELIIVDDCSIDDTLEKIDKYIKRDNRIRVIKLNENLGVAKERNIAIEEANGRYIAFLDSDDKWKYNKLEKQLAFMNKNSYGLSFTAYEYIDSNSDKGKVVEVPNYQDYKMGLKNTIIGCLTVIVDRQITGEFYMPVISHGEDHFTWLALMKRGFNAYGLNECLAEYRITQTSLSSNKFKSIKMQWKNYRRIAKLPIYKCVYYFGCYILNAILKRV